MQTMSKYGEIINQYVAADDVRTAIGATGLSDAEIETATRAVQLERAQWTVNSIATELDRRGEALTERRDQLTAELGQVTADLSFIHSLGQPAKTEKASLRTQELIDLYDKQLSYNTVSAIMRAQPPFVLGTVPSFDFRDVKSNKVQLWAKDHEAAMTDIYGPRIAKTATKCTYAIDRLTGGVNSDLGERLSEMAKFTESNGKVELSVTDPERFFDYLTGLNNHYGYRSMIATMCLGEYQAHFAEDAKHA